MDEMIDLLTRKDSFRLDGGKTNEHWLFQAICSAVTSRLEQVNRSSFPCRIPNAMNDNDMCRASANESHRSQCAFINKLICLSMSVLNILFSTLKEARSSTRCLREGGVSLNREMPPLIAWFDQINYGRKSGSVLSTMGWRMIWKKISIRNTKDAVH